VLLRGIEQAHRHAFETLGRQVMLLDIAEAIQHRLRDAGAGEFVPIIGIGQQRAQTAVAHVPAPHQEIEIPAAICNRRKIARRSRWVRHVTLHDLM